jgi:hypothetical protein
MFVIYQATDLVDGKRYIGRTTWPISVRIRNQRRAAATGARRNPFHLAIRKHGPRMFRYRVLVERVSFDEILDEEVRLIALLKPEFNVRRKRERFNKTQRQKIFPKPDAWCLPGEEWRPLPRHDGHYEISSFGRARRLARRYLHNGNLKYKRAMILKRSKNSDGYLWINPVGEAGSKSVAVHQAVAEAFIGPRPTGLSVLHKDDNRTNAIATNLYYGTQKQNMEDRSARGRARGGPFALKLESVAVIKLAISKGASDRSLAKRYKVTPRTVRMIRTGRTYGYVAA